MAEKDQVLKEKFEYSGLFDFGGAYSFAHSWWKNEGYGVTEEKYSEKVAGNSRDITIEWKITKDVSDYFKNEFKVKFEISGLTNVEADIDGEKKKLNKGKIVVEVTGNLIKDKDSKWETSQFNRFVRDVYNKYVIPNRIMSMTDRVENDAKSFKEQMKILLDSTGRR